MHQPLIRLLLIASLGVSAVALVATQPRMDVFVASRDHPAIAYSSAQTHDSVAALNQRLNAGAESLAYDQSRGYLASVLSALQIPVASQVLVFSQTSAQADRITMSHPRAIYFNDSSAVGWVPGTGVLEIAAHDPQQGMVFYTLSQHQQASPRFERKQDCLLCHLTWDTLGVPGMTVLSTFPMSDDPNAYATGVSVDQRTPFRDRWGGWFVTGQAPSRSHLGNQRVVVPASELPAARMPAAQFDRLERRRLDTSGYLSDCSDVVALMVLDHQAHAINLLTRLGWEARIAGTTSSPRIEAAARALVDYFVFADEAPFETEARGSCGFERHFAAQGPLDRRGRNLRELDLTQRLFKHACSYMVYSPAFAQLLPSARKAALERLWAVLSGADADARYRHLSVERRRAAVEILRETLPGVRDIFAGEVI